MKESYVQIGLCGVLPCMSAGTPQALREGLDALAGAGFPAAEVDCAPELLDAAGWKALFGNERILTGVSARDRAQARSAAQAGAKWITLPAKEATEPIPGATVIPFAGGAQEAREAADENGGQARSAEGVTLCCREDQAEAVLNACPNARLLVSGCGDAAQCRSRLADPRVTAVRMPLSVRAGQAAAQADELKRLWADTLGFTLAHVGINGQGPQDAEAVARAFSTLLGVPCKPQIPSVFAGSFVEVMKRNGRGAHGHIGFATDDLARGMYYAERAGFPFDPTSRRDDANGRPMLYYLAQDIAGFAVHLIQK